MNGLSHQLSRNRITSGKAIFEHLLPLGNRTIASMTAKTLVLLSFVALTPCLMAADGIRTAGSLIQKCSNVDKPKAQRNESDLSFCVGYLNGMVEEARFRRAVELDAGESGRPTFCIPVDVTGSTLAQTLVKYGKDHPEDLNNPAAIVAHLALKQGFQCT